MTSTLASKCKGMHPSSSAVGYCSSQRSAFHRRLVYSGASATVICTAMIRQSFCKYGDRKVLGWFGKALAEQSFKEVWLDRVNKANASTERVLHVTKCIVKACGALMPRRCTVHSRITGGMEQPATMPDERFRCC